MLEGASTAGISVGAQSMGLLSAALVHDVGGKGNWLLCVKFQNPTAVTIKNPAL